MTTVRLPAFVLLGAVACESAPRFTAPMMLGGVEVPAAVLDQGARVYEIRCASCHGPEGAGDGAAGRSLPKPPRSFQLADFRYKSTPDGALPTDEDLDATIRNGRIEDGMPAWNTLTVADRHAVIQYLKTLSPRWK
jgi:mono/diheme cytochrome c family protein